jgi:hypothetical protein
VERTDTGAPATKDTMKTSLRSLPGVLATVALTAGTLTLAGAPASAAGENLPGTLKAVADKECALPWVDNDGVVHPNTPTDYYVVAQNEVKDDAGAVVARWAYLQAPTPDYSHGSLCFVAEAVEPEDFNGSRDAEFSVTLTTPQADFEIFSARPGNSVTRSSGTTGTIRDWDRVDEKNAFGAGTTADKRVAQVGSHVFYLLRSPVALTFDIKGHKASTSQTIDVTEEVTVERTTAEKDAAQDVRATADAQAERVRAQASKKVGKAKAADRAKVRNNFTFSKAKKAKKMAVIDTKARAKRANLLTALRAERAANKAAYVKTVAPYSKTITVPKTTVTPGEATAKTYTDSTTVALF